MSAKKEFYKFPNHISEIGNLIKRRRLQILIHSCLYYELNETLIEDHIFDQWANELEQLLKDYPDEYSDRFDFYFKKWDASSGYDLPFRDPWILSKAQCLLRLNGK